MLQELEPEIKENNGVVSLIEQAINDKTFEVLYISSPDSQKKVSFEKDEGFSNGYKKTLERWMEDPQNLKEGRAGYPLEIFYKGLLTKIFPDQLVYLSPSSLDRKPVKSLPPADIVIGNSIDKDLFYPLLLISSKLSNGSKSQINPLLNTPEITLNARKIWGKKKILEILPDFAKAEDADSFLMNILTTSKSRILEKILEGLRNITKDNITTEINGKTRIKNMEAQRKIKYIKQIIFNQY